ncbi:hypothetical protein AVEN_194482-1 [Araneus ventricosus]|uniref:Uncharacterized protein n=1 Tax=Araneus ventricosus TaxID=182803 RepID=A0A4Y2A624_ARAVE|nr:hypothetical protein AVEN_194482-1 [Araneus ventricosus]
MKPLTSLPRGKMQFRLVILMASFEATRELFWDGLRNIEPPSTTRAAHELVSLSPRFRTTPEGGVRPPTYDLTTGPIHDEYSMESGFEPGNPLAVRPTTYKTTTA